MRGRGCQREEHGVVVEKKLRSDKEKKLRS
jgi:hypothetical protein